MGRGVAAEGVGVVEELDNRFLLRRLGAGALSGVLAGHSTTPVTLVGGSQPAVPLPEEHSGDASEGQGVSECALNETIQYTVP